MLRSRASKLTVGTPQPRAALAASWKTPVGTKIKVNAPDLDAAAKARAHARLDAPNINVKGAVGAHANTAVDGAVKAGVTVKAPEIKPPSVKVDVKEKASGGIKLGY